MGNSVIWTLVLAAALSSAANAFDGELALGNATAQPGQTVTVPVLYSAGTGSASALATDIRFNPAALTGARCETGSALSTAGAKSVQCSEPQPGLLRLLVFGLNAEPMPEGEVARVSFAVSSNARRQSYRLLQTPTAADAHGKDITLTARNGTVRVSTTRGSQVRK